MPLDVHWEFMEYKFHWNSIEIPYKFYCNSIKFIELPSGPATTQGCNICQSAISSMQKQLQGRSNTNAHSMPVQLTCDSNSMHIQCKFNATAMQRHCNFNTNSMQSQCQFNANPMQIQCKCNANSLQILCKCNANAMTQTPLRPHICHLPAWPYCPSFGCGF